MLWFTWPTCLKMIINSHLGVAKQSVAVPFASSSFGSKHFTISGLNKKAVVKKHQRVYLHCQMDPIDFTKAIIKRYQKDTKTSSPHDVRPAPHNNTLSKATTRMAEHFLLGIPLKPFLKQPWIHGKFTKETVTTRMCYIFTN